MDRIRVKYAKDKDVRYISHLDVIRALERALRRAEIPYELTEGFNPKPRMNFSPPLSLGYVSYAEYFDVDVTKDIKPEIFKDRMNDILPLGIKVLDAILIDSNSKSLNSIISSAEYEIDYPFEGNTKDRFYEFLNGQIIIEKSTKRGIKTIDIRPLIYDLSVINDNAFEVWLASGSNESINPMYVLKAYLNFTRNDFREEMVLIIRKEQYIDKKKNTPMQAGVHL